MFRKVLKNAHIFSSVFATPGQKKGEILIILSIMKYNQLKNNVRYVVMQMYNGLNFGKIFLCSFFPQMIIPETKLINTVGMSF